MKYTITIEVDTKAETADRMERLFSGLSGVSSTAPVITPMPSAAPIDNIDGETGIVSVEQPAAAPVEQVDFMKGAYAVPASAPAAPVEQAAPVTINDILDDNGLSWDARIHASTKTKNADGSWRNRRGVDKELIAQIEAELKAGTVPVTAPPVPFVDVVDEIAKTVDTIRSSFSADPFIVPTAPPFDLGSPVTAPVDTSPAAPAAAPTMSYADFMQNLSVAVQTKGLTTDHIKAMCAAIGVADVMSLGTHPELIPAAVAYLDAIE